MEKDKLNQQLKLAKQALRHGDRSAAEQIARLIAAQHPDCLEAWLILAGLAKPEARWHFLEQAQKIAPVDPRVQQAVTWARSEPQGVRQPSRPIQKESALGTTQPIPTTITTPPAAKNQSLLRNLPIVIIIVLSLIVFSLAILSRVTDQETSHAGIFVPPGLIKPSLTPTPILETPGADTATPSLPTATPTNTPTPTPSPTPTVVPNLYGCRIEINFTAGPLEGEGTSFSMLDETYFYDKGDKFDTGKNTGIFYDTERYMILHSGYNGGNILSPLEIEFLRKYLELWGNEEMDYIEGQIADLIGSEAIWRCDGQEIMVTKVKDVVRFSHEASTRLWLEPQNLFEILETREGEPSEWIGEIDQMIPETAYLGFCGWGPPGIAEGRSTYFRYLVQFEIVD